MKRYVLIIIMLISTIVGIYWQVGDHDFISLDNGWYVTENRYVQSGLNLKSIVWAFFSTDKPYWHPLTFISHMLDVQFFGMAAGKHHFTNVFFHILNTLLVLIVFNKMSGKLWSSSFIAALFAVHPLNVESVAWIAERKDVLSTFFMLLTIYSYSYYTHSRKCSHYILVFLCFLMSIASKPMMVTLPFILLILDYWPLSRFRFNNEQINIYQTLKRVITTRICLEKIPFILVSLGACGLLVGSLKQNTMANLERFPLDERICNAVLSYGTYLKKMALPFDLAVFYPLHDHLPLWEVVSSAVVLSVITFLAGKWITKAPFFMVGWLWFIVGLLPVIGLVHGGMQSRADRFTYMPLIGIFIIISFGSSYLINRIQLKHKTFVAGTAALGIFSFLIPIAYSQVSYWKSSISLFEHSLHVTSARYTNLHFIHLLLGYAYKEKGQDQQGIDQYRKALRIKPKFAQAHYYLGFALAHKKKFDEAAQHYLKSIELLPTFPPPYFQLAKIVMRNGKYIEAIDLLKQFIKIDQSSSPAYFHLGYSFMKSGLTSEAEKAYLQAVNINPNNAQAHFELGHLYFGQETNDRAMNHYLMSTRDQRYSFRAGLKVIEMLFMENRYSEAVVNLNNLLKMHPDSSIVYSNLGVAYSFLGQSSLAVNSFKEALRIDPGSIAAQNNLNLELKKKE